MRRQGDSDRRSTLHGRIALAHAIELRIVELKGFKIARLQYASPHGLRGDGSLISGRSVLTASTVTQRVAVTGQNACVIRYVRQTSSNFSCACSKRPAIARIDACWTLWEGCPAARVEAAQSYPALHQTLSTGQRGRIVRLSDREVWCELQTALE